MADTAEPTLTADFPVVQQATAKAILSLRMRVDDAALAELCRHLPFELPTCPNTAIGSSVRSFWLQPGAWLLRLPAPGQQVADAISKACETTTHHLANVSDAWTIFELRGPFARDLLAKGCSLDLDDRSFQPNSCAQTLLAQVQILLDRPAAGDGFDLYCDVSLAHFLGSWLHDAAAEFR